MTERSAGTAAMAEPAKLAPAWATGSGIRDRSRAPDR